MNAKLNDYHPDRDRIIANQSLDTESFRVNPDAALGSLDAKPTWRLRDIYPNIEQYRKIPTSHYTDPQLIAREWASLWTQTWLYAGHVCDLKNPGDWFKFDIGRESILVTRTSSGEVKAHYNTCRHRGTRLVQGDFGRQAKSFMCPFHGWRYGIDGRNVRVVDQATFAPETLCDIDLLPVHCEVKHGLVFINMSANPARLSDYLGDISRVLASYEIEKMHIVKDAQYEMLANWKTTIDAFQEAYHTQTTHPEFKPMVDDYFLQFDFYPNGHNRQLTPFLRVSHRMEDRDSVTPLIAAGLAEVGIDPATFKGGPEDARRAVQLAKRNADNVFGLDYSRFTDDQLTDDWNITVFPNITFNSHPEGVLILRFRPHPTDPARCYYDAQVFVPKLAAGARPPGYMGVEPEVDITGRTRPARIYLTPDQAHHLGPTLEQDASNLPKVQAGLSSRGLGGYVRFGESERRLQQFYCELDLYMNGKKAAAAANVASSKAP